MSETLRRANKNDCYKTICYSCPMFVLCLPFSTTKKCYGPNRPLTFFRTSPFILSEVLYHSFLQSPREKLQNGSIRSLSVMERTNKNVPFNYSITSFLHWSIRARRLSRWKGLVQVTSIVEGSDGEGFFLHQAGVEGVCFDAPYTAISNYTRSGY